MRIAKVVLVAILFLLIPHQAPFAGPTDGAGPIVATDSISEKGLEAAPTAARRDRARREMALSDEGFVWSVPSSVAADAAWSASADHLETDGYSWSIQIP